MMELNDLYNIYYPHGYKGSFEIGNPVWINETAFFDNTDNIYIGDRVNISQGVVVYTHSHWHKKDVAIDKEVELHGVQHTPLYIDDDVYIGAKAMILNGCSRIARGCVVGAGSILTKSIDEPNQIWAGNPARQIGVRN